uniref:C-type lectin domain-containing protein n=1 Tax=Cyclopterus lumpus TaxID=8103 RepID=A0A8C2ZXF3_CYCLU
MNYRVRKVLNINTIKVIKIPQVSFDRAAEDCYPGVLTTIATELEVADILGLISQSTSPNQKEFTFWIGLRKVKNQCVVPTLPLRGFKWTEDGSEDSQVSRWTEEPKYTCTSVRCAALKGEWDGSKVTRWGLIPVTCKNSYQFICKMRDIAPAKPEPIPATQKTEPVECWSRDQVELRCSGHPAVWRLLDNSPASFTTVCLPCGNGFRKDISGNCVDVDECGGSSLPCRHICLNMEGSYRCFCSDENGKHHNEDSPACADKTTSVILIPVLAAVAALVVLLLFVAVTVKCCLMRQSKKPARKEAEKMAMKSNDGRDSFETANEKAP